MDARLRAMLEKYPDTISKEQMFRLCHISRRTALFLLESGLVPCQRSDKKTHRFTIKTQDVVQYLIEREKTPGRFVPPAGWYKQRSNIEPAARTMPTKGELTLLREEYGELLHDYDDLLSVADASKITGFSATAIVDWCNKGHLHSFAVYRKFYIPKDSLIEYMVEYHTDQIRDRLKQQTYA